MIIFSHGIHRLLTGGVDPFGIWLNGQGLIFGSVIAYLITFFEIIGSIFILIGRYQKYLCSIFLLMYLFGLFMVHLEHGWFVVGSGSNGVEYSFLIIVVLFSLAYQDYNKD